MRFRRSEPLERDGLQPFVIAAVFAVVLPVILQPVGAIHVGSYQALALISLLALPGAVLIGIVRHGLYDLDVSEVTQLAGRLLVGVGLVTALAVIYWVAVEVLDAFPLLAAAAAALAVSPLHWLFQRSISRVRTSSRTNAALVDLGRRLESTVAPEEVLPAIVDTLSHAFDLPYVAVEVGTGNEVIAAEVRGELREGAETLPLVSGNRVVGRLAWAPQGAGRPLDPADRRLLEDIAGQLAVAVYALMQTSELQRAKERLVTERETERARWRDAHHDRIKPALSGIVCQLEAMRNICSAREHTTGVVLADVKEQVEQTKTDVWTVKADLDRLGEERGPRSLDELGLVDAVRHHAARFGLPPSPLVVSVEAPDTVAGLPTEVEVAAFLIVCEALENVRKHADALRCRIALSLDVDQLHIEVSDDGRGLPPDRRAGVGIPSMRKRAVDLRGELVIVSLPERGTTLSATFPLEKRARQGPPTTS